jgi:hypothetical protein
MPPPPVAAAACALFWLVGCGGAGRYDALTESELRDIPQRRSGVRALRAYAQEDPGGWWGDGGGPTDDEDDAGLDDDAGVGGRRAVSADGGVPEGATLSDDDPRCGNGVLDPGELCDVAIPAGRAGRCPVACPTPDPCAPEVMLARTCWSECVPAEPPAGCESN